MEKRTTAIIFGVLLLLTLLFSNPTSSFGSENPLWYEGWVHNGQGDDYYGQMRVYGNGNNLLP